jgi:IclR family transcriptional regulator, KDG regulon repressor
MNVQSLDRAFDIVELLSKEHNGLTLTQIGKVLDLHKSTVYRLLKTLKQRGYIERKPNSKIYRLGLGFIELCSVNLNNLELKIEAEPILRKLSLQTNQTVFLAIEQDGYAVYIDKVEKFNSLRRYSIIGHRAPLYCTALGKSLLIGIKDEEIIKLYKDREFEIKTPKTIKDINTLLEDIRISRNRGWSLDDQENEKEVRCLASPIYDYRRHIIAAVSTSWYVNSAENIEIDKIAGFVISAALEISKYMGYIKK